MTGSPDGSQPRLRTTLGQWFDNPRETRPLAAVPKPPNRKEPRYSTNVDAGLDLLTLIQTEANSLTHLRQVLPEDLPYYDTHPRLARYLSRRSMWIYDGNISIGLLAVHPESKLVMMQLVGGSTTASPTIYFRERKQETKNTPSVTIGLSPAFNPYAQEQTTLYPLYRDSLGATNSIADKLLLPLMAQREEDFPLPHPPTDPPHSFMNLAKEILQAATAEYKIDRIQPVFHANSDNGTDTFVVALYKSGSDFETKIIENPKTMTTALEFTTTTGSGGTAHIKTMKVVLGSDGIRISDGMELKDERVPSALETAPALQQIRRALVHLYDLWTIVDASNNPYVTQKARDEIPAVISYLFGLINADGTVSNRLPYLAPFHGIKAAGHIVSTPLSVPPTITVEDMSGKQKHLAMLPNEGDFAELSTKTFLGFLAFTERETAEHRIPGSLRASDLLEPSALKASDFWEGAQEIADSEERPPDYVPPAPGSILAHTLLEEVEEEAIHSLGLDTMDSDKEPPEETHPHERASHQRNQQPEGATHHRRRTPKYQ